MRAAAAPRPDHLTRLLVVDPVAREFADRRFDDLAGLLAPGDLVVVNDAATFPASLPGRTADGAPLEARLVAAPASGSAPGAWPRADAVLFGAGDWRTRTEDRPAPPELAVGDVVALAGTTARVVARSARSPRRVTLELATRDVWAAIYAHGRPVQYSYLAADEPLATFQTPYATRPWAAEMPSAGRPLGVGALLALRVRGVGLAAVTHAAGLSATGDAALDAALPWPERYEIPEATVRAVARTRAAGGRVVAVGTTVVRALEGAAEAGALRAGAGETGLVIDGAFRPRVVDALLTTMHDPAESHFRLLGAFAPDDVLAAAHAHAAARGYLAHELGDATIVLPGALAAASTRAS